MFRALRSFIFGVLYEKLNICNNATYISSVFTAFNAPLRWKITSGELDKLIVPGALTCTLEYVI